LSTCASGTIDRPARGEHAVDDLDGHRVAIARRREHERRLDAFGLAAGEP
jgi:hypothetical protein